MRGKNIKLNRTTKNIPDHNKTDQPYNLQQYTHVLIKNITTKNITTKKMTNQKFDKQNTQPFRTKNISNNT